MRELPVSNAALHFDQLFIRSDCFVLGCNSSKNFKMCIELEYKLYKKFVIQDFKGKQLQDEAIIMSSKAITFHHCLHWIWFDAL